MIEYDPAIRRASPLTKGSTNDGHTYNPERE